MPAPIGHIAHRFTDSTHHDEEKCESVLGHSRGMGPARGRESDSSGPELIDWELLDSGRDGLHPAQGGGEITMLPSIRDENLGTRLEGVHNIVVSRGIDGDAGLFSEQVRQARRMHRV